MKKILCSILSLLLLISIMPVNSLANNVDEDFYKPSFSIEASEIPRLDPGSSKKITFNLKNNGNQAKDLVITPIFEGSSPFTQTTLTNTISMGDIRPSSTTPVELNISTQKDAQAGNHPVKLRLDYKYIYVSGNSYMTRTETTELLIYIRVTGDNTSPTLIVSEVSTGKDPIGANQEFPLNILFQNRGNIDANEVNIRLNNLDNNSIYIGSGSNRQFVNRVPGNSTSAVNFNLKTANNIKSGSYELELVFSYDGKEEVQKIFIPVGAGTSKDSNLLIKDLEYQSSGIGPNKDFPIKFTLENKGNIDAKNITVKLESTDPNVLPKTTNIRKINSLNAETSQELSFVFFASEDAATRNYPISISIDYEDDLSSEKHSLTQYVGMYVVNNQSDSTKGVPKLIIDKYSFNPELVRAGENFNMSLSFFNTNSSKSVRNIKIFLTAEPGSSTTDTTAGSSVFTPVNSSNTFYIDSIAPKGKIEKTITMFTIPDALAKTHTITAHFEYEDADGNEYKATELIGVPVVQQSKLDTGELSYPQEAFLGESVPISVEFYNTGRVTLYNLMVKLEGDFDTDRGQHFVGNFQTGGSEYFEGYVIPSEEGLLEGDLVFTYEDSTGQSQEVRKPFSFNVASMPIMDDDFMNNFPMEEEKSGLSPIIWILIVGGLGAGGFIYKKKRKANKDKDLELDE